MKIYHSKKPNKMLCIFFIIYIGLLKNIEAHVLKNATLGPVVDTNVGSIRGLMAEDGNYSMFMGIPYAEVNKSNVFGPAIPYPKFKSTFNAYDDSAICPQREEFNRTITGSLDCLHLNVYVPNSASAQNQLPVLVWIYGGIFKIGFAGRYLYGPRYLVRHDIIFVTFNYRLGPYGFMCLDIPEVIGNQGLKDQVMALRWVKENIAAFGGDPTRITLGGSSSGASCVDYHLHFCKEELFSKVILQSGNLEGTNAFTERNVTVPFRLAESLNYTTNNLNDAIAHLNIVNTNDVIKASVSIALRLKPCVEKAINGFDNYITEYPRYVKPRVKNIDILMGFTKDEMKSIVKVGKDIGAHKLRIKKTINDYFNFTDNIQLSNDVSEIMERFYFNDNNNTEELKHQVEKLYNDFEIYHATIKSARKYLNSGSKKLYMYLFSYSGRRNFVTQLNHFSNDGARHADELGYLFDISYMNKHLDHQDELMIERMTELWTNFIKYGNPTPKPTELVPLLWPQVTQDSWQYLELDSDLRIGSKPFHSHMAFLDLLFLMNKQYLKTYREESDRSAGRSVVLDVVHLPFIAFFISGVVCHWYACH